MSNEDIMPNAETPASHRRNHYTECADFGRGSSTGKEK